MTAVDIFKASRMQQIEDTTVVSGLVDPNGHLLLKTRVDETIDAGNVIGPMGPGFTYLGAWAPDTVYAKNDVVTASGSTFVVNTAHTSDTTVPTAVAPGANLSLWAQKGADGTLGRDGSTGIPAGTISLWASDTAPANWLICDGSAVSRTLYPSLFESIGVKYGAGDGVNTFNLPNLQGRTPVGLDSAQTEFDTLGKVGGAKTQLLTAAQSGTPAHKHYIGFDQNDDGVVEGAFTQEASTKSWPGWSFTSGMDTGGGYRKAIASAGGLGQSAVEAHSILQPYSVVNFIIKATAGETPGDSELATRLNALESNFSSTPAGTMTMWGSDVAPTNWLICDGAAVSRTTYASLFSAIGIRYGVGDGSTTFNLPNLKGRVPVGRDSAQTEFDVLGETGGAKTHTLSIGEIPKVSGSIALHGAEAGSGMWQPTGAFATSPSFNGYRPPGAGATGASSLSRLNFENGGGGGAHNNLQPYQVVNYIIKFTNGDTKADSQLTQRVGSLETRTNYLTKVKDRTDRLQRLFNGGGIRKCLPSSIAWTGNFRTMGSGMDPTMVPSGYFNIAMPPDGTVIPVTGNPTVTSVTVAGGYIPLGSLTGYAALYYDIPYGAGYSSDPSRFKLVDYTAATAVIPPSWVLVCLRNIDFLAPTYMWGDGRTQDDWRGLVLSNGWVNYNPATGTFPPAAYRINDDGRVVLRGLIAGGTASVAIAFDVSFAPEYQQIFTQVAASGTVRLDISKNAELLVGGYTAGGSNSYVSLEGISWQPGA